MADDSGITVGQLFQASGVNSPQNASGGIAGIVDNGVQTGMKLAQMQEETQQKQIQTKQMQDQINQGKITQLKGIYDTAMRTSPTAQKVIFPQLAKRAAELTGGDPDSLQSNLSSYANDPEFKNDYAILAQQAAGKSVDPDQAAQAVANLTRFGLDPSFAIESTKNAAAALKSQNQLQNQLNMSEAKNEALKAVASGHDQARVDAANVSAQSGVGQARMETAVSREAGKFLGDKIVISRLNNLDSLNKATSILDQYKDDPNGIPVNLLNDAANDLASSMRIGGAGGVSERQATEVGNLRTALAEKLQHAATINGLQYVNDPELVGTVRKTIDKLHDDFAENVMQQAKARFRTSGNSKFNDAQVQALNQLQDRIYGRTTAADQAIAAASGNGPAQSLASQGAQASGAQPPTAAPPAPSGLTAAQQAFVNNAKSHGYSDADIQAYLAKQGK